METLVIDSDGIKLKIPCFFYFMGKQRRKKIFKYIWNGQPVDM